MPLTFYLLLSNPRGSCALYRVNPFCKKQIVYDIFNDILGKYLMLINLISHYGGPLAESSDANVRPLKGKRLSFHVIICVPNSYFSNLILFSYFFFFYESEENINIVFVSLFFFYCIRRNI